MTHLLMVLYAGSVFLGAGACLLEISRLLGKAYETKVSAPAGVRALVFVGAAVLFGYGGLILFPGRAIQTQQMSIGLPLVGTVVLGMALWLLEYVTGEREPPPWSVDIMRLAALLGWGATQRAAFLTPPAAYRDATPEDAGSTRLIRFAVFLGAISCIGIIAAVVLSNSAGA